MSYQDYQTNQEHQNYIINIRLYSLSFEEIATFEYKITESEIKQKKLNPIFYEKAQLLYRQIKEHKNVSSNNPHEIKFMPLNTEVVLTEYEDIFFSKYSSDMTIIYEKIDKDRYLLLNSYKKRLCNYSEDFNFGFGCDCYKCNINDKKIYAKHRLENRINEILKI